MVLKAFIELIALIAGVIGCMLIAYDQGRKSAYREIDMFKSWKRHD